MKEIPFVIKLIEKYGENATLSSVLKRLKRNRLYKCPKCNGSGEMEICINPGRPDMGKYYQPPTFGNVDCDVCAGYGYTEYLMEKITEIKTIGYKKKD